MIDRADSYRERCKRDGWPNIIRPPGVDRIGKVRFGNDGMRYIGRKKCGPYLSVVWCGRDVFIVRHSERVNVHRFERLRWKLLLHQKKILATWAAVSDELKVVAENGRAVGIIDGSLLELRFFGTTIERRNLSATDENVLDLMGRIGTARKKEQRLIENYVRLTGLVEKYWATIARLNGFLHGLLRSVVDAEWESRRVGYAVTINGRDYYVPPLHSSLGDYWPSPLTKSVNLDIARYGSGDE